MSRLFPAALMTLLSFATPALAETDAKPHGTFGKWEAAYFMDNGHKVCYMATQLDTEKTVAKTKVKGRDPAYLFITHWPADNEKNAVTVNAGYSFKAGSKAAVEVNGKKFDMATGSKAGAASSGDADEQLAWMQEQKQEDDLAAEIQKGSSFKIEGTSKRGNVITDTYSLDGSSDAYAAISKECGY